MNKDKIYLSIVIPVYNGELYIRECLESIYSNIQNEEEKFEVVIIDDGSKDKSADIYNQYNKEHKNIITIKNENHGVSYTRNCGIKAATGKYVMFVDADDKLIDDWFQKIKKDLIKKNDDMIFYSQYFTKEKESKQKLLEFVTTYDNNIKISGPYSKMFKREFLINNKILFNEKLINGEDMLFTLEALKYSDDVILEKKSIYIVRHNLYSSTSNFNNKIINSEKELIMQINDVLETFSKDIDIKYLEDFCYILSIRTLLTRLSYLEKYTAAHRIYLQIFEDDFYEEYINNKIISIKNKVIRFFIKTKLYFVVYMIYKHKNKKTHKNTYEIL